MRKMDQGASRRAQSCRGRANSRSFFSFLINFGQVRRGALAHTCLDLVVYLVPSIIPLSNLHWGNGFTLSCQQPTTKSKKSNQFQVSQFLNFKFLNFTEVSKYSIGELRRGPACGGSEV